MTKSINELEDAQNSSSINQYNLELSRYSALKTIGMYLTLLGWVTIIIGAILFFVFVTDRHFGFGFALGALAFCVIAAIPILAYANLIDVYIDIERNTRNSNRELTQINQNLQELLKK